MKNVFVSYSHKDLEFAKKFTAWLEKNGHAVWMDKKRILPGGNYVNSIADGIKQADAFIPLLSKGSVSSKWVAREIIYALESDREIIPVLVEFADIPDGLKFAITGLHHVDFTGREPVDDPWAALEAALKSKSSAHATSEHTEQEEKEKIHSSGQKLKAYINGQVKKKTVIASMIIGGLLVVVGILSWQLVSRQRDGFFGATDKITVTMELPNRETITVKGVRSEIEATLQIAYASERSEKAPSAAIAVMIEEKGKATSSWRSLQDGESLSSADNYRIVFQPEEATYFYIFQIDSRGKLDWLYPANSSSPYSSGSNPSQPGLWIQMPGENEAFHLDENTGIEHVYVVASRSRWIELEKALEKTAQTKGTSLPVKSNFNLKTRGVGGTRIIQASAPKNMQSTSSQFARLISGQAGALVVEKWFHHVSNTEKRE